MIDISSKGEPELDQRELHRFPVLSDTNINTILMNGAQTSMAKLKRAKSFNARLYYFAEISVYLEVSLSRGAGINDETRKRLEAIHQKATHIHMQANKALHEVKTES
jgi:hypothetical protein